MLIDISDILHICVYELGRTYLRFAQALNVNIVFAGKQFAYDITLYVMIDNCSEY